MVVNSVIKKLRFLCILISFSFLLSSCTFIDFLDSESIDVDTLNHISTVVINSNLKIKTTTYRGLINGPYEGTGSGVIIKKDSDYYYALTNNHVVHLADNYDHKYDIADATNDTKRAVLVVRNEDYDLAILKFHSEKDLEVMKFASRNPNVGDLVFSIGNPDNMQNIITAGTIQSYKTIDNVSYEVIVHDAIIRGGSSGGMLINDRYEIVGLNTWGFEDTDSDEEYFAGGATPVEKIQEFFESVKKEFTL